MVDNEKPYYGLSQLSEEELDKLLHAKREQLELAASLIDDDFTGLGLLVALREIQPATTCQLSSLLGWNVDRVASGIVNLGRSSMVVLQGKTIFSSEKGTFILSDIERACGIDFRSPSSSTPNV